jgi:hypothetical protein
MRVTRAKLQKEAHNTQLVLGGICCWCRGAHGQATKAVCSTRPLGDVDIYTYIDI